MATKRLSWNPVRRGLTYCAPACGSGCTYNQYVEATKSARAALKMMHGEGWRSRVWENMGWHFMIYNGPVQVHQFKESPKRFWSMISSRKDDHSGGHGAWTPTLTESFSDPNDSVADSVERMAKVIEGYQDALLTARLSLIKRSRCTRR